MPTALVELAALRPVSGIALDAELLEVAREHRMPGLLWTWASEHASEDDYYRTALAFIDLRVQAHLARVRQTLIRSVETLREAGIEVATLKGVTAEDRWYARRGERPCSDVDLLLAPHQLDRASDAMTLLAPDHPWHADFDQLAMSGRVQTVTLTVDDVQIDLHLDPLKLGFPTRQASTMWATMEYHGLAPDTSVRVMDDTTALLQFLVHLNKDRFQRLIAYADVARLIASERVDWTRLYALAFGEGIETSVVCSLAVVLDELGLEWPDDLPHAYGWRVGFWHLCWPKRIRLRGREGRERFRARQRWITVMARGRRRETVRFLMGDIFPPRVVVDAHYESVSGPYLWKLIRGRIGSRTVESSAT